MQPQTIFFITVMLIFLAAMFNLFKGNGRGVKIKHVNDYTHEPIINKKVQKVIDKITLNHIKPYIPKTLKNQRQKRKQNRHINKY